MRRTEGERIGTCVRRPLLEAEDLRSSCAGTALDRDEERSYAMACCFTPFRSTSSSLRPLIAGLLLMVRNGGWDLGGR